MKHAVEEFAGMVAAASLCVAVAMFVICAATITLVWRLFNAPAQWISKGRS
jgi:hypothetical protein